MANRIDTSFAVNAAVARQRASRTRQINANPMLPDPRNASEMARIIAAGVKRQGHLTPETMSAAIDAARRSGGKIDALEKAVYRSAKKIEAPKQVAAALKEVFDKNDSDFVKKPGVFSRLVRNAPLVVAGVGGMLAIAALAGVPGLGFPAVGLIVSGGGAEIIKSWIAESRSK